MSNQEKNKEQDHGEEHIQDQDEVQEKCFKCFEKFSSFITKETDNLTYVIATEYGLLDVLVSNGGLTYEQVYLIKEKDSHISEVRQLLQEITTKGQEGKKEAFLNALDQTGQKHVSNYIRGKGERAAEYGDDWPLYFCTAYSTIAAKYSKLAELLDPRNGLLDEMFSANCINKRQKHSIEDEATDEKQTITLLQCIYRGSLASYNAFIHCLSRTKQHQVVSLLKPSLAGDIRPLSDDQQSRLKRNYSTLVRIVNLDGDLIAALLSADCITWRQKEYIEHPAIQHSESVRRLIDIMRRGSEVNFYKFIECLDETGLRPVSNILFEGGTVAFIIATTNPANNREQREIPTYGSTKRHTR
jgi:Caspase recruitment domain